MGRHRRANLPGAVFHLTARTQGGEQWFTPTVRSRIVDYVAGVLGRSDARLLAYAVMSNHLHLVLRQGSRPLSWVMQPILRRTALLVHRTHGLRGHVFERRYDDRCCTDADYARNAIVYANLNPLRAGLVEDPGRYPWSSHAFYAGDARPPAHVGNVLLVEHALRLFAPGPGLDCEGLRASFADFVAWRLERDRYDADAARSGSAPAPAPSPPRLQAGDEAWALDFASPFNPGPAPLDDDGFRCPGRDLGAIAKRTLAECAPHLALDLVRSGFKGREAVLARHAMIRRMSVAGFPGTAIARFLRVSDQCVSRVLRGPPIP